MVWDIRRLHKRKGDCCGLCCCPEDIFCCCFGKLLSPKQAKFSGLYEEKKIDKDDHKYNADGMVETLDIQIETKINDLVWAITSRLFFESLLTKS